MGDRAASMLATAWLRGAKGWWLATGASLSVVVVLVVLVAGLFAGMESQTQGRIEDVFTHDVRITPDKSGAAREATFAPGTLEQIELDLSAVGEATRRLESTFVLSRRSIIDAYLQEDDGFEFQAPGTTPSDKDFYGVGILLGVDVDSSAGVKNLQPYLESGAMPEPGNRTGRPLQLVLSLQRFAELLTDDERGAMQWPPTASELRTITLEVTAARIDNSAGFKDIIRLPAEVVGVYSTGLDAIDTFTGWTSIEDMRRLLGHASEDPMANALLVNTKNPVAVAEMANERGLAAEGRQSFAERYMGQLFDLVQALAVTLAAVFLVLPLFLLWYGLAQQLDKQTRELAVCRALGIQSRQLMRALVGLTWRIVLPAVGAAVLLLAVLVPWLHVLAMNWPGSPVPLGIYVRPSMALGVAVSVAAGAGLALWAAARNLRKLHIPAILRSA